MRRDSIGSGPTQITRRRFLGAGLSSAALITVGSGSRSAGAHSPLIASGGALSGVFLHSEPTENKAAIWDWTEGVVFAVFSAETIFWRDLPVGLTGFRPGDEVCARGVWVDKTFLTHQMSAVLHLIEDAVVLERQGDRLETSKGVLRVTASTAARDHAELYEAVRPEFIGQGDVIAALCRRDSRSEEWVVLQIATHR